MIEKYYIIAAKDNQGFIVPWSAVEGKPPELHATKESAQDWLNYIKSVYQGMLDAKPQPIRFFDRVRGGGNTPRLTDAEKNRLRNFIKTAIVREVVLKL